MWTADKLSIELGEVGAHGHVVVARCVREAPQRGRCVGRRRQLLQRARAEPGARSVEVAERGYRLRRNLVGSTALILVFPEPSVSMLELVVGLLSDLVVIIVSSEWMA